MSDPPVMPFDISSWNKPDRGVLVKTFIASAVKMNGVVDPRDSRRTLLHWRGGGGYRLGLSDRSTSFDTRTAKDENGRPCVQVQLISKDFQVSRTAPYHWQVELAKDYTTTQIFNLMVAHNFNRYAYNGNGSGCLTWTTALVKLLEDNGVLPPGSLKGFLETVAKARADPQYWVPDEPGAHFF
ncbi:hypothetical protein GY45DRAFT_1338125 [Cubamyces sp. BRFM 1775]|nr:hypothetical protein GY45DRAFT_1338125 [Cubamyces sp. BRFM 1775]